MKNIIIKAKQVILSGLSHGLLAVFLLSLVDVAYSCKLCLQLGHDLMFDLFQDIGYRSQGIDGFCLHPDFPGSVEAVDGNRSPFHMVIGQLRKGIFARAGL